MSNVKNELKNSESMEKNSEGGELTKQIKSRKKKVKDEDRIDSDKFLRLIHPDLINPKPNSMDEKLVFVVVLGLNGLSPSKIHREFCKVVSSNAKLKSFREKYQNEVNILIKEYIIFTEKPFKYPNEISQEIEKGKRLKFEHYADLARSFGCEIKD